MATFADEPKAINNELFRDIDRREFEILSDLIRRIVSGGERALIVSRLRELGQGNRDPTGNALPVSTVRGEDGKIASRK
jgi:hypothetical protein